MTHPIPISTPAGFAPQFAMAFAAADGSATSVTLSDPMPIRALVLAASSIPLTGSISTSGTAGPFSPQLGRSIWVTLSGTWSGIASVQRSTDGGATMQPLTVGGLGWANFSANANEPIGEESVAGATYYLSFSLTSGTASYRIAQ